MATTSSTTKNRSETLYNAPKPNRRLVTLVIAMLAILVLGCTNIVSVNFLIPNVYPMPDTTVTPQPTYVPVWLARNTPTSVPTPVPTAISLSILPPVPTATSLSVPTSVPTASSLPVVDLNSADTVPSINKIEHVVLISVDGFRPDALASADTPHIDELIARGAYSPQAQTIKNSVTLPSHASMVSGMVPEKHGILWGLPYIGWPGMSGPTLFNAVHDAGLSTGMVVGKEKLSYLVLGDSVDELFCADSHDQEVKENAVEFVENGLPDVLFIHFPDVDRVGHAYGWMSPNQLYAVTFVDGMIGEVVAALDDKNYLDNTLIIITADHGGHGFNHGDDSPEDRTIPWLAVGPGVPQGVILTSHINTYDTAATVLHALEVPLPERWDGQPVLEIFE